MELNAFVVRHDTKQHGAPASMGEAVTLLDDGGLSRAVDHHVGARLAHDCEDCSFEIRLLLRVERCRGPVLARLLQFVIVQIDRHDRIRTRQMGSENRPKADSTRSKELQQCHFCEHF